jgi:hypothetical protein
MTLETIKIEQPQKRPTLMIATPMYGGMCTGQFMVGVLQTINKMQSIGVQTYFVQMGNESLITRARNELTRIFLEKDFDYLMFIDADIGFNGDAVAQLMAADKDIACGIYPKKEVDWVAVEKAAKDGKTNLKDYSGAFVLNFAHELGQELHTDETGCIEVRHGGTGFMLIKRKVFEDLADKVPTYRPSTVKDADGNYLKPETKEYFATSIDKGGCLLSEDYHFCELHRKHGGKIHVNPFIKLEHVGTYVYGGDIIKAGGNLK